MTEFPKIKELVDLESFRKRIAMYIGEKKISNLKAFFDGIFYAFDAYQIDEEWIFEGFYDWVAKYYGWKESTAGWNSIILKECNYDEEKSISEFFQLFDKFKTEKAVNKS